MGKIRLDIAGIQQAKETIQKMGGKVWIGEQMQFYKGQSIDLLSVVDENGTLRLKFIHIITHAFSKELHPKEKQVNEIIKNFNQTYGKS